jgi:alanine-alpha-ketoisovalerate/valine-pyruvate aminotransferase
MWERTISCSSLSKTYSITGWRLGYVIAPERIIDRVKKVHDFLTVGAAAPGTARWLCRPLSRLGHPSKLGGSHCSIGSEILKYIWYFARLFVPLHPLWYSKLK